MAFTLRNLSVLAYANGFTFWHYRAGEEALTGLDRSDFFAEAGDLLSPGDILMASGEAGARIGVIARQNHSLVLAAL
ncbi:hypothetical protein AiwAL_14230 [Acidiphilium sp. AL]|uniref:Uncharacterized protein n=1 Tax=Acidiphilium iwatense TaxID=768198 RepID=A0ABS9E3P7_9PROT|nr:MULTISPECIES: hypothetical protein [Acidiphilium]MCF3948282.1 hypothetical protein [Acidiphilium iwatense]MCU4161247.1 hypothetical protein [Acidiphilium sp. AL]